MSKSRKLIDCPDCLALMDCSWCDGTGRVNDGWESGMCCACLGTGESQKDLMDEKLDEERL